MVQQTLGQGVVRADDVVERARGQSGFGEEFGHLPVAVGRLGRALEDHRVARQQRRRNRGRGERHGEVEGRNHHPDAVGTQHREVVLLGIVRVELAQPATVALVLLHVVGVVAQQVGGLFHFTQRFQPVLAHLHDHERAQVQRVVADLLGQLAHDRDPFLPGHMAPRGEGRLGRGDGRVRVHHVAVLRRAHENVPVDRAVTLDFVLGVHRLAVDEHGDFRAQPTAFDRGDGVVERALQFFIVGGDGCIGDLER